jgi:hypothetical protein
MESLPAEEPHRVASLGGIFMNDKDANLVKLILEIAQFALVLLGVIWAYYRLKKERTHTPHVEFQINCNFFGPNADSYLAEFILTANNKGLVKHQFKSIKLRVRGIKRGINLSYWKGNEPRLEFPDDLFGDIEVKHKKYNHIFVEPSVKQEITYITKIPKVYEYIIARAEFQYAEFRPHSTEKVFEVSVSNDPIRTKLPDDRTAA